MDHYFFEGGGRVAQFAFNNNSCAAKTAEKNTLQGELWGKIEQVLSFIHILCLTLKKLSQAIAHPKNHVQPKGDKNISCPENSKDWDNQFSKKKICPCKKQWLIYIKKFHLFKPKSWEEGISVNLLGGGVPLLHVWITLILFQTMISLILQAYSALSCSHTYDTAKVSLKLRDIIPNCS